MLAARRTASESPARRQKNRLDCVHRAGTAADLRREALAASRTRRCDRVRFGTAALRPARSETRTTVPLHRIPGLRAAPAVPARAWQRPAPRLANGKGASIDR